MTRENCCDCGGDNSVDDMFEIKVSKHGRIWWCMLCAAKQLGKYSDYLIVRKLKRDEE